MRSKLAIIGLLPLAVGTGCAVYLDEHDDDRRRQLGDLTIRYTFDRADCEQAGVDRIRIDIDGQDRGDSFFDEVDCSAFFFGITIENLLEDRYRVTVEGLSRQGDILFSSEGTRFVDVVGGGHREYTIATVGTGGQLRVFWTFGGSGECGVVNQVRVTVVDPNGVLFDDARYPCSYSGVEYGSVQEGLWTVSLDGLDDVERILYQTQDRGVVVIRGADNSYTLDLGPR